MAESVYGIIEAAMNLPLLLMPQPTDIFCPNIGVVVFLDGVLGSL